jgi:hypothetical protein
MAWLLIRNETVENILPGPPPEGWAMEGFTVEQGNAEIGMVRLNGAWQHRPVPVPASITRRQCAREMFERNLASGPEMVAMARTGTPPSTVVGLLSGIEPEADRFRAEVDFAADLYERSNPLLIALMTATGATSAQIDDFFRSAATR